MTAESAIKQLKRMATDKERTGDEYNAIMYAIEEIECNRTVPKSYVSIDRVLEIIGTVNHLSEILRAYEELTSLPDCNYCPNCGADMREGGEQE